MCVRLVKYSVYDNNMRVLDGADRLRLNCRITVLADAFHVVILFL